MPIGNGTVLIGMSERSQARMIEQVAKALFAAGAAERVIACRMTKDRAHMHLDTVFTLLDHDKATAYPAVVPNIQAISLRPGRRDGEFHVTVEDDFVSAVADALGVPKLHIVETGGDRYQQEREQWDDGNNVLAVEPGVVVAYERNTHAIAGMRRAGVEVVTLDALRIPEAMLTRPRRYLDPLNFATNFALLRDGDGHHGCARRHRGRDGDDGRWERRALRRLRRAGADGRAQPQRADGRAQSRFLAACQRDLG